MCMYSKVLAMGNFNPSFPCYSIEKFSFQHPLLQISKFFGFHNLTCSVHVHVVLKCNFVVLWSVLSTKV